MNLGLAGLAVAAATYWWTPSPPPRPTAPALAQLTVSYGAQSYSSALAEIDRAVRLGEERVARRPQDWLNQESLARALLARARLAGSTDDLVRAGQALSLGRSQATAPSGPLLTSAAYQLATHRIGAIAADLDALDKAAVPLEAERAEAAALRGDIALYSGRYGEAERRYRAAAARFQDASSAFRIAGWRKYQADFAGAQAALSRGASLTERRTPLFMANVYLQIGSVALLRGDWNEAERCFERADRFFPGHWLIDAHRAQMSALRGDLAGAERGYRTSIASSRAPEVMDALAALYRAQGKISESRALAALSKPRWAERLRLLPEAYAAHAAEHELALGSPRAALDSARRNYAARRHGDAVTLLAAALLANGRAAEAAGLIEKLNRTPWRMAQQYVVLSQAYAVLGDDARSNAGRAAALRINPRAFDAAAGFIWFGHH